MWKAIVAGTAALAIAGTSLVYAQQRGGRDGMMAQRWQPNAEDLRAFGEARLAALKAGLLLTAEQEKNWPAFEQAARDYGKVRMDRFAALRSGTGSDDPVERMRQRATAMSEAGAALKKLADATDPLYKSLDENQKRRFAILNRLTGPDRGGFRGRDGDGMHHWGPHRTDGARWTWNTLADNACSHHIPSLAPAVALPAPRHDRRRTGAAGSPPGGFPFVELTSRDCEIVGDRDLCRALLCAIDPGWPRTKLRSAHSRAGGNP